MNKEAYKPFEDKMKKTINVLKEDLGGIRAGRANPTILDKVAVEYYGAATPIHQLANIAVPEARIIMIQPWDSKMLKEIEKAIQKSDIGINPANDGKVLRLVFPPLTEERRRELTKVVKKHGEEAKVAVRAIRRDAMDSFKDMKKNSEITEDDLKTVEKDMQNLTDKYVAEVDKVVELKEKELLEV